MLKTNFKAIGDKEALIVELKGRLLTGDGLDELRSVCEVHSGDYWMVVLDFAGVTTYLDCATVEMLCSVHASSRRECTRLVLTNVAPKVRELVLLVKLVTSFAEDIIFPDDIIVNLPKAA